MALFCGQVAISFLGQEAPPHRAAAARCALATVLLILTAAARWAGSRPGRLAGGRAGAMLLAAAALSFVTGALELWLSAPGRTPSPSLVRLGLSPAAWAAARPLGFELCGLLAMLSLCAGHAHALALGRDGSWLVPPARRSRLSAAPVAHSADPQFLDVAGRALGLAAVAFAAFAAALHAAIGPGPLSPRTFTAPIAVLAGCSLAAFWLGAPAARALAVARARAAGVSVLDPAALERLARVDVLCVEVDPGLTADAAAAVRAIRDRGVAVHLIGERRPEAMQVVATWLGARAFTLPGAEQAGLHVRDLQHAGAWVGVVGPGDGPAAARADIAITLAAAAPRRGLFQLSRVSPCTAAPLVIGPARLLPLAYAIDLGRAMRARLRQGAILSALFNAALIPCAAIGFCPPAAAALIALVEALLVLANALRLPAPPARRAQPVAQPGKGPTPVSEPVRSPAPQPAPRTGRVLPAPSIAR